MLEVLKTLSGTSVPNVLMGLGAILVLLAFVEKIGTQISLPTQRQRIAAVVGSIFLATGIGVTLVPHLPAASTGTASTMAKRDEAPDRTPQSRPTTPKPPQGSQRDDEPKAERSASAPGDVYTGSLGNLMPDPKLLPDGLTYQGGRVLGPDTFYVDNVIDKDAARRVLRESNYEGIEQTWEKSCFGSLPEGEIVRAIFQVDRTDTPEARAALYDVARRASANDLGHHEWHNIYDSYSGNFSSDCGGAPAVLHWRNLRVGNVKVAVGLMISPKNAGDVWIDDLSTRLVLSMADGIPGF